MNTIKAVERAYFHASSMYKQTHNEYWKVEATTLQVALKEIKHYHKLKVELFPNFAETEAENEVN